MRKATPRMLEISGELIARESRAAGTVAGVTAVQICEKLRPKLSTLMGATGFRTLLTRALALAGNENPALNGLKVDASGTLVPADTTRTRVAPAALAPAESVELLAQLLGLLVAFIGETLTLQILGEVWPDFQASGIQDTTGEPE